MKIKTLINITSLLVTGSIYLFTVSSVFAQGYGAPCQSVSNSNSCITQTILLDKLVKNPQTGTFVDHLAINDPKYSPNANVDFKIVVTNTGGTTIPNAEVKDVLPDFVSFVSGQGNFDANSKTLTIELPNLKAGEARTITLTGKTATADQLPKDQGITCVTNRATVTADNAQPSADNAQFCIEKPVLSGQTPTTKGGLKVFPQPVVKKTPATGPEMLSLFGLIPTGGLGYFLRRKTKLS